MTTRRTKDPWGWLSLALSGALLNSFYLTVLAGACPVLVLFNFAVFAGLLLLPSFRLLGGGLMFAGIIPNLLALVAAVVELRSPYALAIVVLFVVPMVPIVTGAVMVGARSGGGAPAALACRCRRCGESFSLLENEWNYSGCCSRRCFSLR